MPLTVIKYNPKVIHRESAGKLAKLMPEIVASALNVDGHKDATLHPGDVEVWIQKSDSLDVNTKNLEIVIWANLYPQRLANLDARREKIQDHVKESLAYLFGAGNHITGFIWVLLQPGSFGEL